MSANKKSRAPNKSNHQLPPSMTAQPRRNPRRQHHSFNFNYNLVCANNLLLLAPHDGLRQTLQSSSTMTASYPYGQQQQPPPHYPPPPRNGLVNGALNNSSNNNNKKRRNSDEIPDYASQYIPTFPTLPAHSRRQDDYHQHHQQQQQQPIWEPYWTAAKIEAWRHMRAAEVRVRRVRVRDLLSLRLGVVVLWGLVLWWGEEKIFDGMVERCEWGGWEDWVCGSFRSRPS